MASNFFGIVAQSIQRKTFLREFSTNGKSLSHFHCDCRNCQMLLKFVVLYLLFVDEFYKGYFLLYSYMSIHELRHIFDAFCYIAALLNKFQGLVSLHMITFASHNSLHAVMNGVLPPTFPLTSCCEMSNGVKRSVA